LRNKRHTHIIYIPIAAYEKMMDGETEPTAKAEATEQEKAEPATEPATEDDDKTEAEAEAQVQAEDKEEEEEAVPMADVPMGGSADTSPLATEEVDAPTAPMASATEPAPAAAEAAAEPAAAEAAAALKAAEPVAAPAAMPSDPPPSPLPKGNDAWSGTVAAAAAVASSSTEKKDGAGGAYARVEVTDPQQHGDGRSRYTTYHLIVHPAVQDTKPDEVNRRYSDFQWLYRRLLRERAGAIVPLIPHLTALTRESRFSDEVVNFRRRSCEAWLARIVRHPELEACPSLAAFLRSEDELFAEAKRSGDVDFSDRGDEATDNQTLEWGAGSPVPSSSSSGGGGGGKGKDRFRRIKALASKVKVSVRNVSNLERSDDEPAFDEIGDYVSELEVQIGWLSKHSTALVKTYKDQAAVLENIGSKFAALGGLSYPNTHSGNSARLSTLLNKVGDGVSALGLNEMNRRDELIERFERPVQNLARDAQSLRTALRQRREVQIGYTDRASKLAAKEAALENVRDHPRDDPAQQEVRENDALGAVLEARDAAALKKSEFDAVTSRVLREVERFRSQFRDDVRGTVREWASVQVEYYGRANGGWNDIVPFLDDKDLAGGQVVVYGAGSGAAEWRWCGGEQQCRSAAGFGVVVLRMMNSTHTHTHNFAPPK